MKKNIYKLLLSFAALAFVMSCQEDDNDGVQPVGYTPVEITITSLENNVTVMENAIAGGMASYTITATIDNPQTLHYVVNLEQTAGDATMGVDFDTHQIIIEPGNTSGSTTVDVYATGDIETDETFTISASVGEPNYSKLASPFSFSGTITDDFVTNTLDFSIDWSGEYSYTPAGLPADVTIDFCDIDLDVLVFNSAFTDAGEYSAATGACPEFGEYTGLADDTYYMVLDVYDNPFEGLGTGAAIPITVTYGQDMIMNETVFVNNSFSADTPSGSQILLAIWEVNNGTEFTVTPQ